MLSNLFQNIYNLQGGHAENNKTDELTNSERLFVQNNLYTKSCWTRIGIQKFIVVNKKTY